MESVALRTSTSAPMYYHLDRSFFNHCDHLRARWSFPLAHALCYITLARLPLSLWGSLCMFGSLGVGYLLVPYALPRGVIQGELAGSSSHAFSLRTFPPTWAGTGHITGMPTDPCWCGATGAVWNHHYPQEAIGAVIIRSRDYSVTLVTVRTLVACSELAPRADGLFGPLLTPLVYLVEDGTFANPHTNICLSRQLMNIDNWHYTIGWPSQIGDEAFVD